MEALRALVTEHAAVSLALGGLIIGIVFGAVVQRTNFCTMGSLSDWQNFGDTRRLRSWWLATATAIAGVQILRGLGVVDPTRSMYLMPTFDWAGAVIGGLLFGFGMVFAGGCASRNLVRAGTGDLRSLLTIVVMAITGYVAIGGLLGPVRVALSSATAVDLAALRIPNQGLGAVLAHVTGLPLARADAVAAVAVVAAIAAWCFASPTFRASPIHVVAGLGVGACVVAGWALTGLAFDELSDAPVAPGSLTFVRPAGDALEWMQRFTASRIPGFGVTAVFGTMLGAFLTAAVGRRLELATFYDVSDTVRHLFGAVLMGIGGVVALGCTVGQAVTGAATLAMSSFLVFAALVVGGVVGMKVLENLD
ncbi:MAG: YeeE/YedE family protein [Siculibacillus sp.]